MTKRFGLLCVSSLVALSFVAVFSNRGAAQQQSGPEQEIRKRIAAFDSTTNGSTRSFYTADAIVWSNAYSKPHALTESIEAMNADLQVASGRRNQVTKTTPNRIVVARGGEMAHEYSTFHLSFDDEKGHTELDGAMLRVWQLQGNRWVIASEFRRPYGRVVAPTQPAK